MAKCIVSGMGVGGGDGWVLMDEWDAVQSTPITDDSRPVYFYGSLKDKDFLEYSEVRIEINGYVVGKNNGETSCSVGRICSKLGAPFSVEALAHTSEHSIPVKIFSTGFLAFDKAGYRLDCKVYAMNYDSSAKYPNEIDGISLASLNYYGTDYFRSANLHVKVYAKK